MIYENYFRIVWRKELKLVYRGNNVGHGLITESSSCRFVTLDSLCLCLHKLKCSVIESFKSHAEKVATNSTFTRPT